MAQIITSPSHGPGPTYLAFSKDGSHAFTGGNDCVVRIWKVDEGADNEPSTAADADEPVTWLATAEDCWLSSSKDAEVRRYAKDSTSFDAPLTSAAGVAIRCIAIDPKGRRVAVASDELFVKVVDMEDVMNVQKLEGYTSSIRTVTWHPSGNLLTTCTCDGKIVVWDTASNPPKVEKTIEGIIPVVKDQTLPEFSHDCSAVWHTSGQYFYVASKSHDIVTISRSDWTRMPGVFSDKSALGKITALALSPNGVYLLSASQSSVHVWSTQTKRIVANHAGTLGVTINQLAFSPSQNLIAWTDSDGAFTRWLKPIPDAFPSPVKTSIATNAPATVSVKPKTGLNLFGDDNDGMGGMNDFAVNAALDDDLVDLNDDWIVDDMDGALTEDAPIESKSKAGFVKEMVSITKAQPPFQPGSTPFQNKKRYLSFNMLGAIEVTDQDVHQIINIVFFNKSAREGFHFQDHHKYNLGYLGEAGALFACQPEADHPSQVFYRPYNIHSAPSWTYQLRQGNTVLGIAAGGVTQYSESTIDFQGHGNVVVATSENDLTFLSGTGREQRIIALGGDFVSMVAGPEWVLVVHRAGSTTIDGSQNLSYTVINFEDFSVRQRDVLPIPKGHTLKWIGFTDQGLPAMYDSAGYLTILTKVRIPHHSTWVRISDTNLLERRQGKDESYWPVGVSEGNFMCLILKGRQEHPGFPRPLIQELPITLPFRQADAREEQVERQRLFVQTALESLDDELTTQDIMTREQSIDKELVLLIQGACKSANPIPRVIELVKLLHNLPSLDAAIQIAGFYKLRGLQEKIEVIKRQREEDEDRLIVARNKRRRWLKPDPPLRQLPETNGPSSSSRFDPLGDVRPPPVIERPGMARVTKPVIEKTRFTSNALSTQSQTQTPERSTWDDSTMVDSPTSTEKRKRDDVEDLNMTPDLSMPPPKSKPNPFARKVGQDPNRNPFARLPDANKTLHKSESFFEKVDAAESGNATRKRSANGKGKEKEEKDRKDNNSVSRQTTLFGMLAPKKSKADMSKKFEQGRSNADAPESRHQADVEMSDVLAPSDAATLVESQEESQVTLPDGWEETQNVDESAEENQIIE